MVRGKMLDRGTVTPYHVFLPLDSPAGPAMIELRDNALSFGRRFMPTVSNTKKQLGIAELETRKLLRQIDPDLELRSIRRGGLQHMASLPGVKLKHVLKFSQHKSESMLRRYLDWGLHSSEDHQMMSDITRRMQIGWTQPQPPQTMPAPPTNMMGSIQFSISRTRNSRRGSARQSN